MCSATLHSFDVKKLSEKIMHFPTWVDLKGEDSVPETVHHVVVPVNPKTDKLWERLGKNHIRVSENWGYLSVFTYLTFRTGALILKDLCWLLKQLNLKWFVPGSQHHISCVITVSEQLSVTNMAEEELDRVTF